MHTRAHCSIFTVAAVLALAVAGCGGGSGEGDTDTDTDTDDSSWTSWTSRTGGSYTTDDAGADTFTSDDSSDPSTTTDPTVSGSESDGTSTGSQTATDTEDTENPETDGTTGEPGDPGNCCSELAEAGCENDAVQTCVCDEDPFCCTEQWDLACAVKVVAYDCGACEGIGGEGDCCEDNGTPGCSDKTIQSCVCLEDIACCTETWDSICVTQVETLDCGDCP
jgi:hypothetical protein